MKHEHSTLIYLVPAGYSGPVVYRDSRSSVCKRNSGNVANDDRLQVGSHGVVDAPARESDLRDWKASNFVRHAGGFVRLGGRGVKDMWTSATTEAKGFWAIIAGTLVQLFSAVQNLSLMQVMGFLVAVAGLIVQISAYFKNRAETRRAEAEEQRAREKHEAEMYFARRKIEQLERQEKL